MDGAPGTSGPGQRIFDVSVEGTQVLTDFDINALTGTGTPSAIAESFAVTVNDDVLNIDFTGSVNNPKISGIILSSEDGNDLKSADASAEGDLVLSVVDGGNRPGIQIFPNPVRNELFVRSNMAISQLEVVEISSGKLLKQFELLGQDPIRIDISDLSPGIYMLRATMGDGQPSQYFRFVKY